MHPELDPDERREVVEYVLSSVDRDLVSEGTSGPIRFLDPQTSIAYVLLPVSEQIVGLSDAELAAAERLSQLEISEWDADIVERFNAEGLPLVPFDPVPLGPVRTVLVGPVLLSEIPVTWEQASRIGTVEATDDVKFPAFLSISQALEMVVDAGGRLPGEYEWEAALRAGGHSLFVWGDDLPSDQDLDGWLSIDITESYTRRNALGFGGWFWPELCLREGPPVGDSMPQDRYVMRGGGGVVLGLAGSRGVDLVYERDALVAVAV